MPQATFTIKGDIEEFDRVDNVYRVMKREGSKLFKNWIINIETTFEEKEKE